jgi:hypothetical protein
MDMASPVNYSQSPLSAYATANGLMVDSRYVPTTTDSGLSGQQPPWTRRRPVKGAVAAAGKDNVQKYPEYEHYYYEDEEGDGHEKPRHEEDYFLPPPSQRLDKKIQDIRNNDAIFR